MYEQGAGDEQAIDTGMQDGGDVVYELDLGDAGGGQQAAPAPAPAPAAQPDPRDARIAQLEAAQAAINAELTPVLAGLRTQQRQQADRPPIDPSRLDTDPNLKPSDLLNLLRWEQQRLAEQTTSVAERRAAALLSEQTARGIFSAEVLGQGNDYDSLTNRYVAPLVAQNPAIDQLLAMAAPGDPAAGRMIFATIVAAIDRCGGDVLKGVKSVLTGLDAYASGARETAAATRQAARVAAANVLPGSSAAPAAGGGKLRTAKDVWDLTPEQFDRAWAAMGR